MEYQNYTAHQTDWISFLIISVVFIYGLLHFTGAFQLKTSIGSLFSSEVSESKSIGTATNFILSFNSLAILALYLFSALRFLEVSPEPNYLVFLRITFGVLILIALQRLIIYLHAAMTNTMKFFTNYLTIQNQFVHFAAVLSIPFLVLSIYSDFWNTAFFSVGATVFGGIYLFGVVKSIASSNRIKGPLKFHLIFYLCGNEILPFFLFYKILI